MHKYSILVNSCDGYSDTWPTFFYLLKKNWKGEVPTIYLNTESKQFNYPDLDIRVLNLLPGKSKNIAWGERLIDCLQRIEDEYIINMLEDFYFESSIDVDIIDKCYDYLLVNNKRAYFQLIAAGECESDEPTLQPQLFTGMVERKRFANWTLTAGPSLWRKTDWINLTKSSDTPWFWEFGGSRRTWFYGKKIYSWKEQKSHPIFDYDIVHGGAIHRGSWVGYKMKEIENRFNIKINYGNRNVINDWIIDESNNKFSVRYMISKLKESIIFRIKAIPEILYGYRMSKK